MLTNAFVFVLGKWKHSHRRRRHRAKLIETFSVNISVCDFQRNAARHLFVSSLVFINFIKSIVFFSCTCFYLLPTVCACGILSWISTTWRWNGNSTWRSLPPLSIYWCMHSCAIAVEIYLSPVETHCSNVDYFPDMDDEKLQPNDDAVTRLTLARGCVILFICRWVNCTYVWVDGLRVHMVHMYIEQQWPMHCQRRWWWWWDLWALVM